ncbi:MAG: hypothetical protein OXC30_03795 [Alphaproteobacteria bacterium]|nr:hypothetical protein [Alphaproteobacteria bacterium]
MVWTKLLILSSWILGILAMLMLPPAFTDTLAVYGLWGMTILQAILGVFMLGWGYYRAITWPQNTPQSWKKSLFSLLFYSSIALICGALFAMFTQDLFLPLIMDKPPFHTKWGPPAIPVYILAINYSMVLVGIAIGVIHARKNLVYPFVMHIINKATNSFFLPSLSMSLSAIIIATHNNTASLPIHENVWMLFKLLALLALLYLCATIIACKRYTSYTIKELIMLLLSPLIVTRSFVLPPTASVINEYLPQFRHTSLLLNYNLTMEIISMPLVLATAFLCHQSAHFSLLLYSTPLFILFRFLLPLSPLMGQAIGALTLSLWGLPLEYSCITIWALSLCDVVINLAQIFTSYAGIMFFLSPEQRIGKPIPIFVTH